jgi:hypothetical protein
MNDEGVQEAQIATIIITFFYPCGKNYFECPPPSSTRVKKSFGVLLCFYPCEKNYFVLVP